MKSIAKSCCCTLAALATLFGMAATPPASAKARARKLVWRDEFNGSSLDTKRWNRCEQGKSDWNRHMSTRKDLTLGMTAARPSDVQNAPCGGKRKE